MRIFSVKLNQKGNTIENKIQKDDLKYVINQKWIIGIITVLVLVFISIIWFFAINKVVLDNKRTRSDNALFKGNNVLDKRYQDALLSMILQ